MKFIAEVHVLLRYMYSAYGTSMRLVDGGLELWGFKNDSFGPTVSVQLN